jgi:hypothetical protein
VGYEHNKRDEHARDCETQSVERPEGPVLARGHVAIGFVDLELLSRHEEQEFGADAGIVEAGDHYEMEDVGGHCESEGDREGHGKVEDR